LEHVALSISLDITDILQASGLLGESIINGLRAVPTFNITIVSRQSSRSTFPDFRVLKLSDSYPEEELVTAFQGQDAVISLLPTISAHEQFRIVDAAVKASVRRYIPSNFGLNDIFENVRALIHTCNNKAAVIGYLRGKESTGMTWTAIAMGSWVDWFVVKSLVQRKNRLTNPGH
jgi:hypothetical protein